MPTRCAGDSSLQLAALAQPMDATDLDPPKTRTVQATWVQCKGARDPERIQGSAVTIVVEEAGINIFKAGADVVLLSIRLKDILAWSISPSENGHNKRKATIRYYHRRMGQLMIEEFEEESGSDGIVDALREIVQGIILDRQKDGCDSKVFDEILSEIQHARPISQIDILKDKLRDYYLTGKQGHAIVKAMSTEFDQVEAACIIYPRLVEPAQASIMLSLFETAMCDNIIYRVHNLDLQ